MDFNQLQDAGAFMDTALIKKRITWLKKKGAEPVVFDIHIAPQPFGVIEKLLGGESDRSAGAQIISMAVRLGEDGLDVLTYDQAYSLHPSLAWAFTRAINEASEVTEKNLPPTTSSGANSSFVESADEPSQKPKND